MSSDFGLPERFDSPPGENADTTHAIPKKTYQPALFGPTCASTYNQQSLEPKLVMLFSSANRRRFHRLTPTVTL
jgi:hypothetical protein